MKRTLTAGLMALALAATSACGSSDDQAKKAGNQICTIYHDALADSPESITDITALAEIKPLLAKADDVTRRAFAALITAADANPFLPGADPNASDRAAADARAACLSEHGIEIAG